ncbi:MAG: hypothetical protein QNJ62_04940 [Methyloceanibacter sp.]|nr:hypothetical protein [Methyloceanibacter sp.]
MSDASDKAIPDPLRSDAQAKADDHERRIRALEDALCRYLIEPGPKQADLRSLAAEIEAAPGDICAREAKNYSEGVLEALGYEWQSGLNCWLRGDEDPLFNADFNCLASRDDAHALLPEGWELVDLSLRRNMKGSSGYWRADTDPIDGPWGSGEYGNGHTEPAARTAAALYARAAMLECKIESSTEMEGQMDEKEVPADLSSLCNLGTAISKLQQERALSDRLADLLEDAVSDLETVIEVNGHFIELTRYKAALAERKKMREGK